MGDTVEIAIIGAGPAGISAAASAAHHRVSHVLFEKGELANTLFEYQKRKLVMAEPRRLPLRARVPFAEGSREQILDGWARAVADADIHVVQAEVRAVKKRPDGLFDVAHAQGTTRARHVVLAIGVQGTPRRLGVPGESLPHVAYTLSDPDAFEGRHILVAGAGDSAIENALALCGKNTVAILNRSAEFARAREANVKLVTDAIARGRIRLFPSSTVSRIEPERVIIDAPDGEVALPCDHVIVRAGAIPPRQFLESCGIPLGDGPAAMPAVDARYESSVKGLFVLGALIGYPLIKQALNQGYEVVEHILGNPVEPADMVLLRERLGHLPGTVDENFRRIRDRAPLFAALTEPQFRELLVESTTHVKKKGETLFKELDYSDTVWSVISGSVESHSGGKLDRTLFPGGVFGTVGLISGRRRTSTAVAAEDSLLVETPRKMMMKLISAVPKVRRGLDEEFMRRALSAVFPETAERVLYDLAHRAQLRTHKKGEVLFREGDPGDSFYVIRRGSVKISIRDTDGHDITRSYLAAGKYFGELALLSKSSTRTATVTAAVACETIELDKSEFLALLDAYPTARARIDALAEERRLKDVMSDVDRQAGAMLDFMYHEGVTDASNLLVIDSDRCVGCDNCEQACAATHDGTSRLDRSGGKFYASVQLPVSCRHCENPLCMLDCPPDALARNPDGEVVIRASCIGCGNCVTNCPYGVITLVHERKPARGLLAWLGLGKRSDDKGPAKAAKCDGCVDLAGGPACVRACPTGAAVRIDPTELDGLMRAKGIGGVVR